MTILKLFTERLCLVPLSLWHFDTFYGFASDENINYMVHYPMKDRAQVHEFLVESVNAWHAVNPKELSFAVTRIEDNIIFCIGVVTLYFDNNDTVDDGCIELGWLLAPVYRGQGLMTEAVASVMNWARCEFKPFCFVASCDVRNVSSRRLCERLNMRYVKERYCHERDEVVYATLVKNV